MRARTEVLRGPTQAFAGRIAGARVELPAGAALGTPGARAMLCEVGGDGELRAWNVFARASHPSTTQILAVVGFVEWAVDGATFTAEFDVKGGARLALAADRIKLEVANEGTQTPTTGGPVTVQGAVCLGSGGNPTQATRTRFAGALAPLGAVTFPVPPFAMSVRVSVTPIGTLGGYFVELLDSAGAVISQVSYNAQVPAGTAGPGLLVLPSQLEPLELPGDVAAVRVTNGGEARTAVRATFSLCL